MQKGLDIYPSIRFIMRLTFIFFMIPLCFLEMICAENVKSQDINRIKINIDFKDASLKECLQSIESQSGFIFSFQDNDINREVRKINLSKQNITLKEALDAVLSQTGLTYHISGNYIFIEAKVFPPANGTLQGVITDSKTGETLIGAAITVKGTGKRFSTDNNGNYKFDLPPGTYDLEVKYLGFVTRTIKGVVVKEKQVTVRNINLEASTTSLNEVKVEGQRVTNREVGVLNERKNSDVIQDAISAQNMEKMASITTAQALQRVTGVTTTDDKYVAIRGLGDRNVVIQVNGSRLSSSDADHNSVAIDIIPTGFLENINVYKTVTPDKPADAVAGIVELRTKTIADSFMVNVSAQFGANSNIGLGGGFTSFKNSDMGFLGTKITGHDLAPGFKDLSKEFPYGSDQVKKYMQDSRFNFDTQQEANNINNLMHSLDPNLTTSYKQAQPDQTYGFTIGDRFHTWNNGLFSVMLGLNYYRHTEESPNSEFTQWSIYRGQNALPPSLGFLNGDGVVSSGLVIPPYITPGNIYLGKFLAYTENTGKETLNYGAMSSVSYRQNGQTVKLGYIYNGGGENTGDNQAGSYATTDFVYPILQNTFMLRQTYKTLTMYQAEGDHQFHMGNFAPRIVWSGSRSLATQDDPDYRYVNIITNYNYLLKGGTTFSPNYFLGSQGVISSLFGDTAIKYYANANSRMFRLLKEKNYNATIDLHFPFKVFGRDQLFKAGGFYLEKRRNQEENVLYLPQLPLPAVNSSTNPYATIFGNSPGDPNQLISYDKIGLSTSVSSTFGSVQSVGFVYNTSKSPANYNGSLQVGALYGMLDVNPLPKLRLIGGLRYEITYIKGSADTLGAKDVSLVGATPGQNFVYAPLPVNYKTQWIPFPSVNIVYSIRENIKLRGAYARTLARPELRETLPIIEFDAVQQAVLVGNPALKDQLVNSVDFRAEWYPAPGEVWSVSFFGKLIDKQINKTFQIDSAGVQSSTIQFPVIKYDNDPNQGKVYGVEIEARKSLGIFSSQLKHFFVGVNMMLAASVVDKNPERLHASRIIHRTASPTSPLFEQPPYVVNVMLDYDNPVTRTNVTLSFNQVGERLVQVQLTGEPDIYTRPQPMLNLVFAQNIGKSLRIKGYVKNLLDAPYREVYADPGHNGQFFGRTYTHRIYHQALQASLGFSMDF